MSPVVIWDVGGTLLDRRLSNREIVLMALMRAGIDPSSVSLDTLRQVSTEFETAESTWSTIDEEAEGYRDLARILISGLDVDQSKVDLVADSMFNYYDAYYRVPQIETLLQEVSDLGVQQAVLSNWMPSLALLLKHHGLLYLFEVVITSGEVGVEKPDPHIFLYALERLSLRRDQVVYVGNERDEDILPARSLGIAAVHFDPRRKYDTTDLKDVDSLRPILLEQIGRITQLPGD